MIEEMDGLIGMQDLADECIDLIVTDPPYGIEYRSNKQNYDTRGVQPIVKDRPMYFDRIANDTELPITWLAEAYRILKPNTALYTFAHWSRWHLLYPAVLAAGFTVKNMVVLNKSNHGMGDLAGQYAPKHELLLFAVKGRHILRFQNGREKDVWDVPIRFSGARRWHPNEKPEAWITPAILNSSNPGEYVLDPFAGSGTTLVAALRHGRRPWGFEIDALYVGNAQVRLAELQRELTLTTTEKEIVQ